MANALLAQLDCQGWTISQPASVPHLIVEETFAKALDEVRASCDDPTLRRLQATGTPKDVTSILEDAESKYNHTPASKARKWTTRLSSSIMHYDRVLDIIAQQHQGQVALVWGTLQFLLMGVVNCENLLKELCKALSHVTESLRHVQLNLLLYPTTAMQDSATRLLVAILTFTSRALKWYGTSRSSRVLSAFTGTLQLKFRDVVEDILETGRSMDRLALAMSQVENRQMRLEITETRKVTEEIKSTLEAYSQLQQGGLIDTNKRLSEVQFSQILSFLATSSFPDPEHVRHHYASKRNLRRRKQNTLPHSSMCSSKLQEWGALKDSSQILVQGSFRYRQLARDFAVDMIELIAKTKVPVVWALDPTLSTPTLLTSVDILKQITLQVLRLNHTMLNERAATLNAARFQSTVTESGWFSLLGAALEGLSHVYIVIDLEVLARCETASCTWMEEFLRLFRSLSARSIRTVLKVAFVSPRGACEFTPDQVFGQSPIRLFSGGTRTMTNAAARGKRHERSRCRGRRPPLDFQPRDPGPGNNPEATR